jgi:competence protein ComEA
MLPEGLETFFYKYRFLLIILLGGVVLIGVGIFLNNANLSGTKVEVLEATTEAQIASSQIVVEIAGEVEKPGVYRLPRDSRVEDLLVLGGGVSSSADRSWMEKTLNRAAKLNDGQKIYIPAVGEQSSAVSAKNTSEYQTVSSDFSAQEGGLLNINTASLKELDALPGIGPVYGQNIIEHRPYSNVGELLSRAVLIPSVYEKIKDLVTAY